MSEDKSIKKEFKIKKEPKTRLGKFWNWLWYSDSFLSWVIALVLAFVVVKFIFFPLISFLLGTKLPLVVVESGSMHHPGSFLGNSFSSQSSFELWWNDAKSWYESRNITQDMAEEWPMRTGMEKGDIIVVYGRGSPKLGDVIIFEANTAHPIIHRIIRVEQDNGGLVYSTKGDNNADQLYIEKAISQDQLIGRAVFKIPKLGWLKLVFVEIANLFSKQA
jgi:signal peptidase I